MLVQIVDGAATRMLRRAVLRPHLGPDAPLPGDELPQAVHVAAVDDGGEVVGTCFLYADPCPWLPGRPAWHLRQMATATHRQGQGVGAAVVDFAVREVRRRGAEVLWCNARETARGFYGRAGFVEHGPVFTDAEHVVPHVRMWRELRDLAEPGGQLTSSG